MGKAELIQSFADSPDRSVNHARRRHNVHAGPGMGGHLQAEIFQRSVMVQDHLAIAFGHYAAMAVIGIFAKANIRNHHHVRQNLFDHPGGLLNHAVIVVPAFRAG
ncbi:MAG: hypothetical protein BWY71_02217 [Planctomycetes bacterium ADurb.Bin412]|nr:MAG: hypothetical protein BWY71_02217 [Planctomycetes bacterium ADurb.Bin412]